MATNKFILSLLAAMSVQGAALANGPSPAEILKLIQGRWSTSTFEFEVRGTEVYIIKPPTSHGSLYRPGMKIADGLQYAADGANDTRTQIRYKALATCYYAGPSWPTQKCESHVKYLHPSGMMILSVSGLPAERKR